MPRNFIELCLERMVLLDVTTGLRRSELFALKWSDIDFWNLVIDIRRSICEGVVGNCKTETSRKSIPLSLDVAAEFWLLKENTHDPRENGNSVFVDDQLRAYDDQWEFLSSIKRLAPEEAQVLLRKVYPAGDLIRVLEAGHNKTTPPLPPPGEGVHDSIEIWAHPPQRKELF